MFHNHAYNVTMRSTTSGAINPLGDVLGDGLMGNQHHWLSKEQAIALSASSSMC